MLVDDHLMMRNGLSSMLNLRSYIKVDRTLARLYLKALSKLESLTIRHPRNKAKGRKPKTIPISAPSGPAVDP